LILGHSDATLKWVRSRRKLQRIVNLFVRFAKLPLLDNCSCIVLLPSIHGHMLTPLTGAPDRYIPVGDEGLAGPAPRHFNLHLLIHELISRSQIYSSILDTTPAPTVRPPSRIAKRSPSSIAIGAISATSIFTLSPGITISTPEGSSQAPVTSVVRK
jgi:hypothetical protein